LSSEKEEKKVRDVMSSPVVSVLPTDSVFEAASRMMSHGVGAVVVESGGRPEGIVTERDLIKRVLIEGKDPKRVACREIMSRPLVTIDPEASILKAVTLMKEKEIRRIVVVKGGRMVGIVTEKELIKTSFREILEIFLHNPARGWAVFQPPLSKQPLVVARAVLKHGLQHPGSLHHCPGGSVRQLWRPSSRKNPPEQEYGYR